MQFRTIDVLNAPAAVGHIDALKCRPAHTLRGVAALDIMTADGTRVPAEGTEVLACPLPVFEALISHAVRTP